MAISLEKKKDHSNSEFKLLLIEKNSLIKELKAQNEQLYRKIGKLEAKNMTLENEIKANMNELKKLRNSNRSGPIIYLPDNGKGPPPTHVQLPSGSFKKISANKI